MEQFPGFFQSFPPLARVALAFFLILVVLMLCRRFSLAALVAYGTVNPQGERLIDEPVLNTAIVLMVVTSILGPIPTEKFAIKIVRQEKADHPV